MTIAALRSDRVRGLLLLLAGTILFALSDALVKLVSSSLGTVQIVWGRYFTQAFLLFVVIAPHRSLARLRTRRLPLQLLRVGLLFTATLFFYAALEVLTLAATNALFFVSPLLITLLSAVLLRETVGLRRWIAAAIGFAGVVLVIQPGSGVLGWAALLPLVAAVCSALYHVTTPVLARAEDPINSLYFTALIAGIGLSLVVPFFWTPLSVTSALALLAIGALGTVGHFCMIRAFHLTPASTLSPFLYVHMVWATTLGWLLFGTMPRLATVIGAFVILGSGLYVYRQSAPASLEDGSRKAE